MWHTTKADIQQEANLDIQTFAVEEWMNKYELDARYNLAETCCDLLTVEDLIR